MQTRLLVLTLFVSPAAFACESQEGAWELSYAIYLDQEGAWIHSGKQDHLRIEEHWRRAK